MTKNRKKAETYRFNGVSGIKAVGIANLSVLIANYEHKLADPSDQDDKKWTARWLNRLRRELLKKERSILQKQTVEKRQRRPVEPTSSFDQF